MDILTTVLVIRHPCAIVTSWLNEGWLPEKVSKFNHLYLDSYPEICKKCECLFESEELAALAWCMCYHAPLMECRPYPFVLVRYEKLLKDGQQELERIFKVLDIPLGQEAIAQLYRPSDTVMKNSQVVVGEDLLAGWFCILTSPQIDNILAVIKSFDLDFYSEALEPDYEKMMSFGSWFTND